MSLAFRSAVSLLAGAMSLSLAVPALADPAQRPEVAAAAQKLQQQVVDWRRDFHRHPELSNREERTARVVADELRRMGLEPKTGIAHHGVVAIIKGGRPGPRIALRADMDALPVTERTGLPFASKATAQFRGETVGVMHACGHDAHTGILLGVAQALVDMRATLPGEVMLVFQPAEEGPPVGEEGGASLMLAQGLFDGLKPEAVFGLHVFSTVPAGQIAVRSGPLMAASDRFTIKVVGRQPHGSRPWVGVDPIVAAADLVGTIRTFDEGMRQKIFADLRNVSEHVAAAHGARVEAQVPDSEGNPPTVNDPALTAKMLPSLQAVVGAGNVFEPPLQMGAEDFSLYGQKAPALFFFVGATGAGIDPATAPGNHSPEFLLDEKALDVGFRALLQVSLDFLHGTTG